MQISTKGRYALRLMLDLAVHNTGELSGADYFVLEEGWICEESERSAGRIYAGQGSKNLYGRDDSQADGRQYEACSLSGG